MIPQIVGDFSVEVLKATIVLFIIVDPIGNIPIFIGLTKRMGSVDRSRTLRTATLVALALLLAFAIGGQQFLIVFGVSLGNFMIAGGLLLLILAIKILIHGGIDEEAALPESLGAVPIGFPLLVGPGAITATIVILQTQGLYVALSSVLVTFGLTWLVLRFIEPIHSFLGKTGAIVVARVMAIFIAAIAMQFIVEGVRSQFV